MAGTLKMLCLQEPGIYLRAGIYCKFYSILRTRLLNSHRNEQARRYLFISIGKFTSIDDLQSY